MYFKKAISPVVAVALLLVTAVVAVVGFQSWFNDFSSQVFSDTETQSSNSVSQTGIDQVIGNTLYFRNSGSDTITINSVTVEGNDCHQRGSYSNGVGELDLYDCMNNLSTTTPEVVVYTDSKIYSKEFLVPESFSASFSYPSQYFVSVWQTDNTGASNNYSISLPLESSGTYNFDVDWGDGNAETITTYTSANHTYSSSGKYIVKINGTIIGFKFSGSNDGQKLIEIRQWGDLRFQNNGGYFAGANNLEINALDSPNLTGITNFNSMFSQATNFEGDLSFWDVSEITTMSNMFFQVNGFNNDIGNWNVSSVTNMAFMFYQAGNFNQDLSSWDVDQVSSCSNFNTSASSWVLPQPVLSGC